MTENKAIIEIRSEGFLREYCVCRYIRVDVFEILKLIAAELNRMFPDRKAKNLEVVCAGPIFGEVCAGNPAHTYRGDTFDLNYFTLGDTNHSQWPAPLVEIWKDRASTESEISPLFDAARNIAFFIMLKKVFPRAAVIVDTRIKKAMIYSSYNKEDIAALSYLSEDSPMNMNHHTHIHIYIQGHNDDAIDWRYVNEVLTKEGGTIMEAVWQTTKANAVSLAKAQGKKILLLEGTDYCGYCSEMKAIIASSPVKELVESCFILWYDKVTDGRAVPVISIIDPAKPDEYLTRTLGRQDAEAFYQGLLKYSCVPVSPYIIDVDKMFKDFQVGVSVGFLPAGASFPWCDGIISRPKTPFGLSAVIFTDNKTGMKISGLDSFSANDVMTKLYDKFPAVKETLDKIYCKDCNAPVVPCPECEPCIEPACLLADIKTLTDPKLQSVLNRIVCKIYGTCK
jgi:hypothetical protein